MCKMFTVHIVCIYFFYLVPFCTYVDHCIYLLHDKGTELVPIQVLKSNKSLCNKCFEYSKILCVCVF